MASSSNNAPTTSGSTNEYFFYGTHPLRVTHYITHSNSENQLLSTSDQHTQHLSLPLTNNHNGFLSNSEMPTTQSLHDFPQCHQDQDENTEIFEDAVESFDDDDKKKHVNRKASSSSKHHEAPTLDLPQAFAESIEINKLFFGNHLNEALAKTKAQENRSFYHGLSHSTISYLHATMTFNPEDIEIAMQALRRTISMTKKYEPYRSWIPFNLTSKPAMTEYELHAKLVYAEALLLQSFLTFIQDQSIFSFINGALKIKECHDVYIKLAKQNDPSRFSTSVSHEHFDSGVRFGNGAFNLIISNLPQRIIRCLEFAGFSGDRELGLKELEKSATSNGLRSLFSTLLILCYHTFVTQIFGNGDGDFDTCHQLVEHYLTIYPDSYLLLFFRARLLVVHCRIDEGISTYQYATDRQTDWKDFHHMAHWEIQFCHLLKQEWKEASVMAKALLDENNWSKATYCYLLATFLYEDNNRIATDEVVALYRRVPELKIRLAGKSIPLEKYAIKQCEHFHAQQWLFLPGLEFLYILNGFYILAHDLTKLNAILDIVNNALNDLERNHQNDRFYMDSYGSGLLLRGTLLHFLQRYDEAHEAFNEIIYLAKKFDKKSFLAANATLEKGLIYLGLKQKQRAIEYLHKSLNDYKDYQLESRLQFRINTAMHAAKQLDS